MRKEENGKEKNKASREMELTVFRVISKALRNTIKVLGLRKK